VVIISQSGKTGVDLVFELPTRRAPRQTKDVKDYLSNNKGDKSYARVARAAEKNPRASLYELQHGMNSAASRAYRARHETVSDLRGIDFKDIHKALNDAGVTLTRRGNRNRIDIATDDKRVYIYGDAIYDSRKDVGGRSSGVLKDIVDSVVMSIPVGESAFKKGGK
jgi:hypothetical protein